MSRNYKLVDYRESTLVEGNKKCADDEHVV